MLGIWDYFRRLVETPTADKPADPLEVQTWHEGKCRYVEWTTREATWEECGQLIDRFLASAIPAAASAGKGKPLWLVLTFEMQPGALTLVPEADVDRKDEVWPIHMTLQSQFLKDQALKSSQAPQRKGLNDLSTRVWRLVSRSLTRGEASRQLAEARVRCSLRVAGYDYDEVNQRGGSRLNEVGEVL